MKNAAIAILMDNFIGEFFKGRDISVNYFT